MNDEETAQGQVCQDLGDVAVVSCCSASPQVKTVGGGGDDEMGRWWCWQVPLLKSYFPSVTPGHEP